MFDFVAYPIGYMLNLVYNSVAFQNYGAAIIILTLIIKIILMPLVIGQQNSSSKLNNIQPELKKIQEKYKDNAEKLSQETMKLYKSQGVNPFTSMMSIFIQMPILFSMYHVVSNPMKYMMLGKNELLNMNFFGINLAATPTWSYDKLFGANISNENLILLIVPIAAVITSYIATKYSMKQTSGNNTDQMQSSMMSTMALISPIMTGIITFTVPAGLGLYWIISNAFQIVQQFLMNKFIIKKNSSLDSKWMKRISGILSSL